MPKLEVEDGIILPDTPIARKLGFTSNLFSGYLWKKGDFIYISFIISLRPGEGNFRRLLKNIEKFGYGIKVPTPLARMKSILIKHGFRPTMEYAPEFEEFVEVWVKPSREVSESG